jgi:hypothetical protein
MAIVGPILTGTDSGTRTAGLRPFPALTGWRAARVGGDIEIALTLTLPPGYRFIYTRVGWSLFLTADGANWLTIEGGNNTFERDGGGGTRINGQTVFTLRAVGTPPRLGSFAIRGGGQIQAVTDFGNGQVQIHPSDPVALDPQVAVLEVFDKDGSNDSGGDDPTGGILLSWFQARDLARKHGAKIRRAGWRDRYLTCSGALWLMHPYDALTKVESDPYVVKGGDKFTDLDFRALDWMLYSPVDLALVAEALDNRSRYP